MKKCFFIAAVLLCFIAVCPFAQESDDKGKDTLINKDDAEKIKESGKQALNDMKGAFKKASDALDKQMKSISSKACVGQWKFQNGDCSTILECLDDGTMQIVQQKGNSKTLWKGAYTSTSTEIQFHVLVKESKVLFSKVTETPDEYWTINYKVSADKEMKLSSPEIPHDGNEYDFSNSTLFTKM